MPYKKRSPNSYELSILPKRKKYSESGRCIDCGKDSETYRCLDCKKRSNAQIKKWRDKNKDHVKAYQQRWRDTHKENTRISNRKNLCRQYGLTTKEYNDIISRPCGICGTTEKRMCVDHCHSSDIVRGALCISCNAKLGWYEKNAKNVNDWVENNGRR